jgi:hypothetical protein
MDFNTWKQKLAEQALLIENFNPEQSYDGEAWLNEGVLKPVKVQFNLSTKEELIESGLWEIKK